VTRATIVRYETKPGSAEENERLIRAVFDELAATDPGGLRYAAFRLDDGVSFLHVAVIDGEENPLAAAEAFRAFSSTIEDRCATRPTPSKATVIGSYGSPIE
jgi:hypothetical protein